MTAKELGNHAVHPILDIQINQATGECKNFEFWPSLTKREAFAMASLIGIQSNAGNNTRNYIEDSKLAVETADALLFELAKAQP